VVGFRMLVQNGPGYLGSFAGVDSATSPYPVCGDGIPL